MRQSVSITGLNEPLFTKSIESLLNMQNLFARNIGDDCLELWKPLSYRDSSYQSIDLGNRYFTSRRDDPHGSPVSFAHGVDPYGKLAAMGSGDLFHGEDNDVCYFGRIPDKEYVYIYHKVPS
jgi:hypothetical protein